jgi:CspA family cold shock protein
MKGTVKWFNHKKGYGFISGEDSKEYFVHFTAIPKGIRLNDDDKVSFDAVETERGIQAQNVILGWGEDSAKSEEANAENAPAKEPSKEENTEDISKVEGTEDF